MKSLLNKTLLQFVVITVIILFLATPIFYILTKYFYAEDIIDLMEAMEHGEKVPPLDLEKDILQGIMIQFFLIFAVLSFSMIITLRFITRRLWHPFDDTLKKMELFNIEQNSEPKFIPTDIKEFSRLNSSLSVLIKRIRRSYRTQKEFTENASHELQTPLAIAQSKLDLLLQEDLNETQSEIIADLYKVYKRMSKLNKNLLLLARIDNAQYSEKSTIDICQFIDNHIPLFESIQGLESSITFNRPKESVMVKANEVLFESMINNLVVNAIKNSSKEHNITILVNKNNVTIINIAESSPVNSQLIFKRFQFTEEQKRGNGLGLAIVKAICDFHGWKIKYEFIESRHNFKISFQ